MVPLTESQAKALAAIAGAWPDTELVLIGALALGRHISMSYRETNDLDIAVAVSIEQFPGPLTSLAGWRVHPKMDHRFISPDGQKVDVLPAGEELIAQGYVDWPSGFRMSLVGFDLAFDHATRERAGSTTVLVPTAPVITFLKMRAWLDRPYDRVKDLADIAHLLMLYVDDDDDRRFTDEVFDLGLDPDAVSPFLLGRDLAGLMTAAHLPHVQEFLERVNPAAIAAHGRPSLFTADDAEGALESFRRGLG